MWGMVRTAVENKVARASGRAGARDQILVESPWTTLAHA